MATENNSHAPSEYEGLVQSHRIDSLEDHLTKCYSSERYEEFQTAVETIIERYLDTDKAHKKLKGKIDRQIKDYMEKRGWRNRNFWIPTAISIVSIAAGIILRFV